TEKPARSEANLSDGVTGRDLGSALTFIFRCLAPRSHEGVFFRVVYQDLATNFSASRIDVGGDREEGAMWDVGRYDERSGARIHGPRGGRFDARRGAGADHSHDNAATDDAKPEPLSIAGSKLMDPSEASRSSREHRTAPAAAPEVNGFPSAGRTQNVGAKSADLDTIPLLAGASISLVHRAGLAHDDSGAEVEVAVKVQRPRIRATIVAVRRYVQAALAGPPHSRDMEPATNRSSPAAEQTLGTPFNPRSRLAADMPTDGCLVLGHHQASVPSMVGAIRVSKARDGNTWERHDHGDEVLVVLSGAATMTLRDAEGRTTEWPLSTGDVLVIPRGVAHHA